MNELIYRVRDESLAHAYQAVYKSKAGYNPIKRHERYEATKKLVGRKAKTDNPYGSYKSPYYDPVARHERYMRERASLGIGKGTTGSGKSGSGKSGSGKSGSGKSGGKKGKGGKGKTPNVSAQIQKLREESSLNTDAQREATRRKIEDLKSQISKQAEKLRNYNEETDDPVNAAEIRGTIQQLKDQIQKAGGDLQKWISHEKDALQRRIAAIYNSVGKKYTPKLQADKERSSKKRNKEVTSRADAIYKSKSKKK